MITEKSLRKIVVVGVGLLLASVASAHAQIVPVEEAPACAHSFGSGGFVWCVSEAGNLVSFASPAGFEHIRVGNVIEGYAVCVPGAGLDPYSDMAIFSSGWAEPVLIGEPDETSITIERTTTDGRFTLLQRFVGNRGQRAIEIFMTLTNNLEELANVRLLRNADLDIDGTRTSDVFDRTLDSAWARQSHAVSLIARNRAVDHETRLSINLAPRDCTPQSIGVAPTVGRDLAASVRYDIGTLGTGESRTLRFIYRVQ